MKIRIFTHDINIQDIPELIITECEYIEGDMRISLRLGNFEKDEWFCFSTPRVTKQQKLDSLVRHLINAANEEMNQ